MPEPFPVFPAIDQQLPHLVDRERLFAVHLEALTQMFETDRSAARGLMTTRRLVIFEHNSALGTKPADELFARVEAKHIGNTPARDFSDYVITLDGQPLTEIKTVVTL